MMYNLIRAEIEKIDAEIYAFQTQHSELIENTKSTQTYIWVANLCAILIASFSAALGGRRG